MNEPFHDCGVISVHSFFLTFYSVTNENKAGVDHVLTNLGFTKVEVVVQIMNKELHGSFCTYFCCLSYSFISVLLRILTIKKKILYCCINPCFSDKNHRPNGLNDDFFSFVLSH